MSDARSAGIYVDPESLTAGVDVKLGHSPIPDGGRSCEGVGAYELVGGVASGTMAKDAREAGRSNRRNHRQNEHGDGCLDERKAAPIVSHPH